MDTNESGDNSVSEVPAVPEAGVTAQGIAGSGSRRRTNLVATGTDSSILQHQVIKFKVPYDVVRRAGEWVDRLRLTAIYIERERLRLRGIYIGSG